MKPTLYLFLLLCVTVFAQQPKPDADKPPAQSAAFSPAVELVEAYGPVNFSVGPLATREGAFSPVR
jgi:hypothetical protein